VFICGCKCFLRGGSSRDELAGMEQVADFGWADVVGRALKN